MSSQISVFIQFPVGTEQNIINMPWKKILIIECYNLTQRQNCAHRLAPSMSCFVSLLQTNEIMKAETEEIAQAMVTACSDLPEDLQDLSSVLSTHFMWPVTIWNSMRSDTLFWPPWEHALTCTYPHIDINTYIDIYN